MMIDSSLDVWCVSMGDDANEDAADCGDDANEEHSDASAHPGILIGNGDEKEEFICVFFF